MSRAVMEQALEAMEFAYDHLEYNTKVEQRVCHVTIKAIAALRAALAEPQPTPVAWQYRWLNPRDYPGVGQWELEWKHVDPRPTQSLESKLHELREARAAGKPCYEVRPLYVGEPE